MKADDRQQIVNDLEEILEAIEVLRDNEESEEVVNATIETMRKSLMIKRNISETELTAIEEYEYEFNPFL